MVGPRPQGGGLGADLGRTWDGPGATWGEDQVVPATKSGIDASTRIDGRACQRRNHQFSEGENLIKNSVLQLNLRKKSHCNRHSHSLFILIVTVLQRYEARA